VSRWHATNADDETAARIRSEYQEIANHLGDQAPDPEEQVTVSINAEGDIRYTTATAVFALDRGIAVVYRPLPGYAEDCTFHKDGEKIRHRFNPPPNENN